MKVYIVHGFRASATAHWYAWLADQVITLGHQCEIVQLTDSEQPQAAVWRQNLEQQIKPLNEQVIVIAHSLGCLSTLDYLSQALKGCSLKALLLVAGFRTRLASLPELNVFVDQSTLDDALIRTRIQQRYVFFSTQDPFVPAPLSIRLGQLINAQMIEVAKAGHFMQEDGYQTFPALWSHLQVLLQHDAVVEGAAS